MKTKYVVLNNKLLPFNVANLLIDESIGYVPETVQVIINTKEAPDYIHLKDLLLKADQAKINHPYTILSITEMLSKLIKNNRTKKEEIIVRLIQGNKTFLHAYFIE
ncbi:MAG: hypothetical protein PF693_06885 [Spirochaetia bacterium]|nr:hypothetical protein [Spirochaetia bacterium]